MVYNAVAGRLWEVKFEIVSKMKSLPFPGEIVDEKQNTPLYKVDCKKRRNMSGCQLSCTLGGEGVFTVGKTEYKMRPGMAFLQMHNDSKNMYYYPENGTEPWHFIWLSFYSKTAEQIVTDLVKNYGYIYYIPLDSSLLKKLRSFHNYRDSLQFLSPLEGARLVLDTLTGLEKYIPSEKMEPTPQSQIIKKAQEFIFNNITEPIGVEEIAAELSISREHLSRIFKEQLGEPPSSYLMKKKMEAACKLLIYSNLSCKEIAGRIGYESAVSFTRAFKNAVKMTPGELRTAGYIPEIR